VLSAAQQAASVTRKVDMILSFNWIGNFSS